MKLADNGAADQLGRIGRRMQGRQAARQLPLLLGVKRRPWRDEDDPAKVGEGDESFRELRAAVMARDEYTCRYCLLASQSYHEVHHLDGDHTNNSIENLVTACRLCHLCHHLVFAGLNSGAHLIWCPDLPQADINRLFRLKHVVDMGKDVFDPNPRTEARLAKVKEMFNEIDLNNRQFIPEINRALGAPDAMLSPLPLAGWLRALPDNAYEKRYELVPLLKGLRLFPHKSKLSVRGAARQGGSSLVEYWSQSMQQLGPELWDRLYRA